MRKDAMWIISLLDVLILYSVYEYPFVLTKPVRFALIWIIKSH